MTGVNPRNDIREDKPWENITREDKRWENTFGDTKLLEKSTLSDKHWENIIRDDKLRENNGLTNEPWENTLGVDKRREDSASAEEPLENIFIAEQNWNINEAKKNRTTAIQHRKKDISRTRRSHEWVSDEPAAAAEVGAGRTLFPGFLTNRVSSVAGLFAFGLSGMLYKSLVRQTHTQDRIFRGTEAEENSWPWIAKIKVMFVCKCLWKTLNGPTTKA